MKKKFPLGYILAAIIIGLVGYGVWWDGEREKNQTIEEEFEHSVPAGATNIIDRDHGWVEFTMDGNRFLYKRAGYTSAITQIIDTQPGKDCIR